MQKILVVRLDKIGDFALFWPGLYQLRQAFPESQIDVMCAPAVVSFAKACPYVDDAFADSKDDTHLVERIKSAQYDAVLSYVSDWRMAKLLRQAKVDYSLVPAENWRKWLFTDSADIRYRDDEPCWRGSVLYVQHFIDKHGGKLAPAPQVYWDVTEQRAKWRQYYGQEGEERLVFVHAGTGGSSNCLPVAQFAKLLTTMQAESHSPFKVILTYSGVEEEIAKQLLLALTENNVSAALAKPLADLGEFAQSIVAADLFIAGSTGPIHLAGLQNIPTVGFYTKRRIPREIRWQTLTQDDKKLAFTPPAGRKTGRDMSLIDVEKAGREVAALMNRIL